MKVGISTITKDADGDRIINQDPQTEIENDSGQRRVARTATLDGGAEVTDFGYSAVDRTYIIKTRDDDGTITAWAARIVKNYASIHLSTRHGFFKGTPARWWNRSGFLFIEILITEEITS